MTLSVAQGHVGNPAQCPTRLRLSALDTSRDETLRGQAPVPIAPGEARGESPRRVCEERTLVLEARSAASAAGLLAFLLLLAANHEMNQSRWRAEHAKAERLSGEREEQPSLGALVGAERLHQQLRG